MTGAVRVGPAEHRAGTAEHRAGTAEVPLIPRAILFGEPRRMSPSLSGDGRRIGYVAPVDGIANVWVRTDGEPDDHPVTADRSRGVTAFCWAADGRHVLYPHDPDGSEAEHLHAVDVTDGTDVDLTPIEGVQARFIGTAPSVPHRVLVGLNDRDRARHDVYEIDVRTAARRLVAANPGFAGWVHDHRLRCRGAYRWTDDGGIEVLAREHDDAPWHPVHRAGPDDAPTTRVVGVSGDGRSLVVLSPAGAETARLLRIDVRDGTTTVLYADPGYDVVGAGLHPVTGDPDIAVVHRERRHLEPVDDRVRGRLARVRRAVRGDAMLLGRAGADRWWLVLDFVTDGPCGYHVFDFGTGRRRLLFTHQPELAGYLMAPTEPFRFTARDGLSIAGYLTFPAWGSRRHLPTVLAVHGGPWTRDGWGSGSEPQWLANRGYLCVQVNFRGSTGYGRGFVSAGDREWGGRMQDDLVDAVRWLVDRGLSDPERIAIYGSSYGGYAALIAATSAPAVFRCAIAGSAPTDLRTFVRAAIAAGPLMAPRLRRGVGDPDRDADLLWARSPMSRVARARIPILLAHGANDPRVPRSEAERFAAALRRQHTPHRYLVFPDEGHGLVAPRNRMTFFGEAERFLADHLGGRYEAAA